MTTVRPLPPRRALGSLVAGPRPASAEIMPLSKALDKTYDGIIIGAGHHGLILGSYLAKAGLDILLVERRLTYGGGLCTREVTLPGFYHNLHSINHFHISETPWFKDLELDARVTYITPATNLVRRITTARHWCLAATWKSRLRVWSKTNMAASMC
jgi:choline dehydrogenase-like flavoprotein